MACRVDHLSSRQIGNAESTFGDSEMLPLTGKRLLRTGKETFTCGTVVVASDNKIAATQLVAIGNQFGRRMGIERPAASRPMSFETQTTHYFSCDAKQSSMGCSPHLKQLHEDSGKLRP